MNGKRISGIVILLVGVAMLAASSYIKSQVEEGREQISSAQKKVKQANSLFSLNPVAKEVGGVVTGEAEKKINAGQQQADEYEQIRGWLQVGGIVCLVVSAGLFLLSRKKKK